MIPRPAVVDRTNAPPAQFDAALATWEAREAVDAGEDARVEAVARAMWEANRGALSYDWTAVVDSARESYRRLARAAIDALTPQLDTAAAEIRVNPDGTLVAIRRGENDWRVSNGGHYRDVHVADWTVR